MNSKSLINGIIFSVLLSIPLVAEFSTATPDNVPGNGFDVLLYKPFDFAYILLAGCIFIGVNYYFSAKQKISIWKGVGLGVALLITWFVVSFLLVGQLHLSLGGTL